MGCRGAEQSGFPSVYELKKREREKVEKCLAKPVTGDGKLSGSLQRGEASFRGPPLPFPSQAGPTIPRLQLPSTPP